jgi:hypothetical protein
VTRPLIVACAAALVVITSAATQHTLGQNNFSAVARSIALFRKAGKVFQNPALLELPSGGRPAYPNRSDGTAPALGGARHRRKRRARACVQHLSPRGEFRRRGRPRKSRVASRSRFNGVAGAVPGRDLRANQGSGAKRWQGRSCVAQACVRRQSGWMGMVARCWTHSCARHPGQLWRAHASLGRQRSALPAG